MIAFIGVRISWLILDRNAVFALLAVSAAAAVVAYVGTKALVKAIARTVKSRADHRKNRKLSGMAKGGGADEWVLVTDEDPRPAMKKDGGERYE